MKKIIACLTLLSTAALGARLYPQNPIRYYRIGSVKTIVGKITGIKQEACYRSTNFTVLYLEEQKTNRPYRLEVAPSWFFDLDIKKGDQIEATGAYNQIDQVHIIMVRTIKFKGKDHQFRDKWGFPLWRGKRKFKRGIRRSTRERQRRGSAASE
jgi:hypothetical protein